jgi:hypothetical protein
VKLLLDENVPAPMTSTVKTFDLRICASRCDCRPLSSAMRPW